MPGRFSFSDDQAAFETLKKAGGKVTKLASLSNGRTSLCVDIQIGGVEFCAFKTVREEQVAEHLLTDAIAERKAS
jgi:hypothetical protein